jgi:hypothetical protein
LLFGSNAEKVHLRDKNMLAWQEVPPVVANKEIENEESVGNAGLLIRLVSRLRK